MEKELKDYLHLYLGCEIINYPYSGLTIDERKDNPVFGILKAVLDEKVFIQNRDANGAKWDHLTTDSILAVKPVLRHLSDITDEELKCLRSERGNLKGVHRDDWRYVRNQNQWSPEDFIFLLSKHFDLFQLIESGLSLCKSI